MFGPSAARLHSLWVQSRLPTEATAFCASKKVIQSCGTAPSLLGHSYLSMQKCICTLPDKHLVGCLNSPHAQAKSPGPGSLLPLRSVLYRQTCSSLGQ